MNLIFHPIAEKELDEAAAWYNDKEQGLGAALIFEVDQAISRIINLPNAWPILNGTLRRCRTRRFPYYVVYEKDGSDLTIIAIMHERRRPGYLEGRKKSN